MARSGSGISAIFARSSCSPSARSSLGPRREATFRSRALSCIAARSSSVQTLGELRAARVRLLVVFASVMGWLLSDLSGRRRCDGLPLEDSDRVAERVAEAHVGAVEVVDRLLGEVGDASLLERFVQGSNVVGVEDEAAQRALRDQLAELLSGGFVVQGRARLVEGDLDVPLARDAGGEPAVGTQCG